MSVNRFALLGLQLSPIASERLVLAGFLLALAFTSCADAAPQSDQVVARHMKEF